MNSTSVSYTGKPVFIGIDVHRSFFVLTCLCEGRVVNRCRMPGKAASVISFISKHFPEAEVRTCYEAGYSGFWLHRALEAAGISSIVVHAAHVEVEAGNRVKTDKRDSRKLAEQLAAGRIRGIKIPTEEQEHHRLLTRTREQLMRARRRAQVQIRMKLHQFGLFPADIERAIRPRDLEQLLPKLESEELRLSIELLYSEWLHLATKVKELDKQLAKQSKQDSLEIVYRSVPGVGRLSARILSNELGDMGQFPNERALFSFTGLTPGEYSSGNNIRRGHISRQGSGRLRYVLVEAAWKAIRKDELLKDFFDRLAIRAGKKRAIVAVARKLVGRIRAALRTGSLYEVVGKTQAV